VRIFERFLAEGQLAAGGERLGRLSHGSERLDGASKRLGLDALAQPLLHVLVGDDAHLVLAQELVTADVVAMVVSVEQHLDHSRTDFADRLGKVGRAVGQATIDHEGAVGTEHHADVAAGVGEHDDAVGQFRGGDGRRGLSAGRLTEGLGRQGDGQTCGAAEQRAQKFTTIIEHKEELLKPETAARRAIMASGRAVDFDR
jgi:hypothetical protein